MEAEVCGGTNVGDETFFFLHFLFREYVALDSYRCQFTLKFSRFYSIDTFVYLCVRNSFTIDCLYQLSLVLRSTVVVFEFVSRKRYLSSFSVFNLYLFGFMLILILYSLRFRVSGTI